MYLEKQESKVHTINKFRDKTNTLSATEFFLGMERTPAVQG
jgi:hypothetical protein